MADTIIGILKAGEVVIDGLVSVYGRFTGSDGDENEDADESEPNR